MNDLVIKLKDLWYFRTEDEQLYGPYFTEQDAISACKLYLQQLG